MSLHDDGITAAEKLEDAMRDLGLPVNEIPKVAFKVIDRIDHDEAFLDGLRVYFEDMPRQGRKQWDPRRPEGVITKHDVFGPKAPSDNEVVDGLIEALSEATGEGMPWSAAPAYDVLDFYLDYLNRIGAGAGRHFDRFARIWGRIVDLEMEASGRA